ncbi:TPA: hypothetical protein DF272_02970 [Candidatus Falkowbacteria bacterium]|nr:hypothetical protein [Candidatus Falkowbacteria bacterium]
MRYPRVFLPIFAILSLMIFIGAGCGRSTHSSHQTYTQTETETTGSVKTDDFDLETLMTMIRENKVASIEEMETLVNGESGINNVDIDQDGKIDYVVFRELPESNDIKRLVDLVAIPSSTGKEEDGVTIGQVEFERNTTTNQVVISGGYSQHVHGYNDYYYSYPMAYHHGSGFATGLLLGYMFSPRPYYVPMYRTGFYSPRPVFAGPALSSRRDSFRSSRQITKTQVSPISKTTRPTSKVIKSAEKPSKYAKSTQYNKPGQGVAGRAGTTRDYQARDPNQTKRKATGFGAGATKQPEAAPAGRTPPAKPGWHTTPSGGGTRPAATRPAAPRSSGWGGGGARRSSGGGFRSSGGGRRR